MKECKYPHLTQKELKEKIASLTTSTVRIEPVGICYALCAETVQIDSTNHFSYCWDAVNPFSTDESYEGQAKLAGSTSAENNDCPIACLAAEESNVDPIATPIGRNGALCLLTESS